MSREITSSNHGAKSRGKRRPEPAKPPRVVEKDIDLGRLAPETAIVQKIELPVTLRLKLGSLLIHCEEMLSPTGHTFDQHAIRGIVQDPEVVAFRDECAKMGILPVKR